jgi:hypothetical protein
LRQLRRDLERLSPAGEVEHQTPMVTGPYDLARELAELIGALDRRVPRIEQTGEAAIARDAAALRAKAVERLAELATNDPSTAPDSDRQT